MLRCLNSMSGKADCSANLSTNGISIKTNLVFNHHTGISLPWKGLKRSKEKKKKKKGKYIFTAWDLGKTTLSFPCSFFFFLILFYTNQDSLFSLNFFVNTRICLLTYS